MALFVPILRLLMLFLNVYDSYKTLKVPSPSSRNSGRPSIRAMSQRKRDMKGCLAVWVVWASLSMYERMLEAVVCLFIPFYDEFKSLALLFLILTRARGAEPIYLHLIRPLIKPHTRTLDGTLDLMLMVGDFIFALSTYPARVAIEWYRKRFTNFEVQDSNETQSNSSSSNDVNTSELPTSFLASSGLAQVPEEEGIARPTSTPVEASIPAEDARPKPPSRRTTGDSGTSRHTSTKKRAEGPDSANLEPNFFDSKRARDPLNRGSRSPGQNDARPTTRHRSIGDSASLISAKSTTRREHEGSSSRHQIWYPPKSSYVDEEENGEGDMIIRAKKVEQEALFALEQQEYEEWRQYPAFPSAYPPTPLAIAPRLMTTSATAALIVHPEIPEENQQDFPKSLLPPREPLNPNHAGDLSDAHNQFGIPSSQDVDDADDSMSNDDDGYEDEDDFNITLRTPLPAFGSLRSQIQPRRLVSLTSTSSAFSVPSRSSALTTADNGSSLPHGTSSDSSFSAPKPTTSPSILGKKRSYPRTKMPLSKNRVRQIEDESSQDPSSSDHDLQEITATLKARDRKSSSSSLLRLNHESGAASASNISGTGQEEQIPPEEKRRKIVRSVPPRAVQPSRAVRSRAARRDSPPTQPQKGKGDALPASSKRNPTRPRTVSEKVKENDPLLSASSSASAGGPPRSVAHPKPNRKNTARKL